MDIQGLRHLQALRSFIGNLVDQAERAGGCDCHKPPSLLLVGPPGAGKTYLVKQMSNVCEMPLYGVHTNQVRGAPAVRKLFDQARDNYPSLVFMDDIDAIFSNHDEDPCCRTSVQSLRDELFVQLGPRKLKIMDAKSSKNPTNSLVGSGRGVNGTSNSSRTSSRASTITTTRLHPSAPPDDEEDVFGDDDSPYPDNNGIIVVAATSTPWLLYKDHELLSRFRGVYLVGLPDKQTRYNLLLSLFQDVHHNLSDEEIMVVAEKTEGFTPADLMVVVKTLTYRQFSFLLSMSAARNGSAGSSSDVGSTGSQTPLSSELSETASESDLDGLPESEGHLKRGSGTAATAAAAIAAAAAAVVGAVSKSPSSITSEHSNAASGAVPKKDLKHVNGSRGRSPTGSSLPSSVMNTAAAMSAVAAVVTTTLSALSDEWGAGTDHDDEEDDRSYSSPESQRGEVHVKQNTDAGPTRVLDDTLVAATDLDDERPRDELSVPSPDSAIGLSKSSEEMEDTHNTSGLEGGEGAEAPPRAPSESSSSGVTSSGCDSSDSGDMSAIVDEAAAKGQAGHSDSEAERENAKAAQGEWVDRTTGEEVAEAGAGAGEEATETDGMAPEEGVCEGGECGDVAAVEVPSCEEDEERVGTPLDFELHYSEPPEPMRDDNCAIDSDSDNEMSDSGRTRGRRVAFSGMSSMEPLSVDVGGDCSPGMSMDSIPPNITLAPSGLPEPMLGSDRRQDGAPNPILLSLLARPSPARDRDRDRDRNRHLEEPNNLSSFLHPDNNLDVNKTSSPIEPMDALTPTPSLTRTPSPAPSVASSNNVTVASSGSGRRASAGSTSSEVHKKEDSDSSFDHSDGHTVPSSDMSTATCNETGETMECRTDSDERLQELDDVPDHTDSARASEYGEGEEAKSGDKAGLLNLDDLGEISIQLITLADVLEVVGKGYRSVSDEEIKRYTDFMVWFSSVAKSACPHAKDGSNRPNAPHLDEISLDSTVYDTPSISKKRKGPLRKLGRFLLKALMFILD